MRSIKNLLAMAILFAPVMPAVERETKPACNKPAVHHHRSRNPLKLAARFEDGFSNLALKVSSIGIDNTGKSGPSNFTKKSR